MRKVENSRMGFDSKHGSLIPIRSGCCRSSRNIFGDVGQEEAMDAIILVKTVMGGEIEYGVVGQVFIVERVLGLSSVTIVGLFVGAGLGGSGGGGGGT